MSTRLKNITIISSYFAPAWAYGGPPKVLFTLAKSLVRAGISVNVITTDSAGGKRIDELNETLEGIKIYRFKNLSNALAYKANCFYAVGLTPKVQKILNNTDIALFSDIRSIFNCQLYNSVIKQNIPYGIFAFGEIPYGVGVRSIIKRVFDAVWVKDYIKNAKWLFAQTKHERRMYEEIFNAAFISIHLLPLPVEKPAENLLKTEIKKIKNKLNIMPEDRIITFVGRINYLKGIDILLRSVERLLREDKKVKFVIVGRDDGYLSALQSLVAEDIKKQVIFAGALYDKDLEAVFSFTSCFAITPRFHEETSTAALQALSYGIPIVVTKEAEVPHLTDYQAGYSIENDLENIRAAIKKIIYSSALKQEKMSSEARKCTNDHFLAEKVTGELIRILSK